MDSFSSEAAAAAAVPQQGSQILKQQQQQQQQELEKAGASTMQQQQINGGNTVSTDGNANSALLLASENAMFDWYLDLAHSGALLMDYANNNNNNNNADVSSISTDAALVGERIQNEGDEK